MNRKTVILMWALCCLISARAFSESLGSGSAFLQMDTAARPSAMGGAYTALTGSVDSLAYNPAGLSAVQGAQAAFTHAEWLVGTQYDHLAFAQGIPWGTLGVSATRLGYGDLEGRDASRQSTGQFSAYDSAYTLGYAHAMATGVGLGAAVKLLDRKIATDRASSYALDFGAVGRVSGRPLWLGITVLNIGPGTRFINQSDQLPLTFALGAAYRDMTALKITADLKYTAPDQTTRAMAGMEYSPLRLLALRAGYQMPLGGVGDQGLWRAENVRGGVGVKLARLRLDYALIPFGDLGLTHRLTLSIRFATSSTANSTDLLAYND
jgi:hypothetical protein